MNWPKISCGKRAGPPSRDYADCMAIITACWQQAFFWAREIEFGGYGLVLGAGNPPRVPRDCPWRLKRAEIASRGAGSRHRLIHWLADNIGVTNTTVRLSTYRHSSRPKDACHMESGLLGSGGRKVQNTKRKFFGLYKLFKYSSHAKDSIGNH